MSGYPVQTVFQILVMLLTVVMIAYIMSQHLDLALSRMIVAIIIIYGVCVTLSSVLSVILLYLSLYVYE